MAEIRPYNGLLTESFSLNFKNLEKTGSFRLRNHSHGYLQFSSTRLILFTYFLYNYGTWWV